MYSPAVFSAFELFFGPWRARRLRTVLLPQPGPLPLPGMPIVLVANHTSWWDGFLLRDVQRRLRPRAPFHVVMREDELRRHPAFRLMGALPLRAGSLSSTRALVRSVRAISARHRDAVFAWFPQGAIWPSGRRPLGFRRGIELIVDAASPCWIVPVGLHIEPLNRSAPTAFIAPGPALAAPGTAVGATQLEAAVTARLDAVSALLHEHGEAAVRHIRQPA
jgi:1-acyl-sn-glycerol-3-phosphate acyltransferase